MNQKTAHTFCSIITSDYFFYIQALYDSLIKYDPQTNFKVLVVDVKSQVPSYGNLEVVYLNEIKDTLQSEYSKIAKYESDPNSNLRWALKPLFIKYLLTTKAYEKVIFLDPDLFFYNDPTFLFERLATSDVIITPHWRSKDPFADKANFDLLFTEGLFNAGFIGFNVRAINILDWWLNTCSYKMEKQKGFYVDQAYLNLLPIYFKDQVDILEHRGCNVSNWNLLECERTIVKDDILINNRYPIIFIHFTNATINRIANGKDKVLKPYLDTYKRMLSIHQPLFQFNYEKKSNPSKSSKPSFLKSIYNVLKRHS